MRRLQARILQLWLLLACVGASAAGYAYADYRQRQSDRRAALLTGGDPAQAVPIMRRNGCAGCHSIRGVAAAGGFVGPELETLGRRLYVGGVLPNTPENLVRWILDPKAYNPRTAMPVTGITEQEARHVAAYLYALR